MTRYLLLLCALALLSSCQTAGVTLAGKRKDGSVIPAHLRLPVDARGLDVTITQNTCRIHADSWDSSGPIIAQGKAAHDVENGVQGIIMSGGSAFGTNSVGGAGALFRR